MSNKAQTGKKWVSQRVLQHQQCPVGVGKMMEDSAISAARIRENEESATFTTHEAEVPAQMTFEVQEATDALSNLYHSVDYTVFQLKGEVCIKPAPNSELFYEKIVKDVQLLGK